MLVSAGRAHPTLNGRTTMQEMDERALAEEQENERLNGCCECGETGHGCNDCTVFGGPGTPNPGSDEAREAGCICAILDNNHGTRPPYPPDGWWITAGCPVHAPGTA